MTKENFLLLSELELKKTKLQTPRPSKVPIHYRDRLSEVLTELEKYKKLKQIESSSDEKHTIGTTF